MRRRGSRRQLAGARTTVPARPTATLGAGAGGVAGALAIAATFAAVFAGCTRGPSPGLGPIPRFVDVTADSGLPATGMTSGAVFVDLDGDGRRDLLLGRHALLPEAYRNVGGLRFQRIEGWGAGLDVYDHHATLADDLDGDGAVDFYFVVGAHRGEGAGNKVLWLSSQPQPMDVAARWGVQDPYGRGRGALMLDVDGDGARDLLVFNYKTAMRAFHLTPGEPARDRVAEWFGFEAANDSTVGQLLEHGGPSAAERRRGDWVHDLAPQDLDGDGRPDYFALGSPPARVVRFAGGRAVADLSAVPNEASTRAPQSATWGDFDADGVADLYLTYGEDDADLPGLSPRRNRLLMWPRGSVTDAADDRLAMDGWGLKSAAADLDNNGTLDLIVQQSHHAEQRTRCRILLNEGGARFQPLPGSAAASPDEPGLADGIVAADFDEDGDLDLLLLLGAIEAGQPGGGVRLLRNDLSAEPTAPHWLRLQLDGNERCLPYGARVEVTAAGRRQFRQYWPCQVSGSAYRGAVHLGLGAAGRVDELVIHWPTGQTSVRRNLEVDCTVTVVHP